MGSVGRTLLVVLAVVLALGLLAGCRKDSGSGDGGGIQYLPAPTRSATGAGV
jgi:predicted small secreted protein